MSDYHKLELPDEHMLYNFLKEYMEANDMTPYLAGVQNTGQPFMAWLSKGDLRVLKLYKRVDDSMDTIRGGSLDYPVVVLSR